MLRDKRQASGERSRSSRSVLATRGWAAWCAALLTVVFCGAASGWASGPRWMSGPPFFNPTGYPVVWYTDHPKYFTDAGDLSPYVRHGAADALVASAASVWNVPTSRLVLTQGGFLNEHVSGANVYASRTGLVFPSDVSSANYQSVQIAVIYDSDGSVTDMMLGGGASDPSGCLQNAVTESVDSMVSSGYIHHALLVLNGRCTGSAPEMQLQMQYQLERAFGRVLGLAWSQLNDNVFTGTPTPTYNQALHWPIMHPIDIICGPYTYQCLPQPFTLRPDDISSISQLYYIAAGEAPAGKVETLSGGSQMAGSVTFPNGQGMEAVNVVARRMEKYWDVPEAWETASAVTGYSFRRTGQTPLATQGTAAMDSLGTTESWREGVYQIQLIPVPQGQDLQSVILTTEPINSLYTGTYAVGPYQGDVMSASGSSVSNQQDYQGPHNMTLVNLTPGDAPSACNAEGTERSPMQIADGGWWSGTLCSYGHVAWTNVPVKANRTLTVEVTSKDESGFGSLVKAMPGIGVWRSTDPTGTLPTVAQSASAFNGLASALTTLPVRTGATGQTLRIAITDQRGAGRPDFNYNARVLYADRVTPSAVSATGGTVTITGMGFRQGNAVTVNGVQATVTSWSTNTLVATVPPLSGLGASWALTADVQVQDLTTGGTSTISSALTYAAPVETLAGVSVPSGTVPVGSATAVPFSVKALARDGVTGEAGKAIVFSAAGGGVKFGACGAAATCTVVTNGAGVASTTVTPSVQGSVVLSATGTMGTVTASFTAGPALPDTMRLLSAPSGTLTVGAAAETAFAVSLLGSDGVTPKAGQTVTFSATGAGVSFGVCGAATCAVTTDASGSAATTVTLTTAGQVTLRAASSTASVSAVVGAAASTMQLAGAPATTGTVGVAWTTPFAVKVLAGDGATPQAGAPVVFAAAGGGVRFGACGGATCTVLTNASGVASSPVTPLTSGPLTLSAVGSAGSVTADVRSAAEAVQVVTAPSGTVTVGKVTATPFAVRVLAGDGVTPMAGVSIVLAAGGGVQLGACGAASCTAVTDGSGSASTSVLPQAAGAVTITATLPPATGGASASASFAAANETVRLLSAPGGTVTVGKVASTPFTVRVFAGDGVTPMAGESVLLSGSAGLRLGICGAASCTAVTDGSGQVTTAVSATAAGAVGISATLPASGGAGTVSATFAAAPESMVLVSAPGGPVTVGSIAPGAFAVRVFEGDGTTPVAGEGVVFAATLGNVQFGGCPTVSCTVITDASGTASAAVRPMSSGPIVVSAAANAGTVTASFTSTALPDVFRTVSVPAGTVFVGEVVAQPMAVQVMRADGVTPVAGAPVVFLVSGGAAVLGVCGASQCTVLTNGSGIAATTLTATAAGGISVTATAQAGVATATVTSVTRVRAVTASRPVEYIAEGATVAWAPLVTVTDNGALTAGAVVSWTASGSGISLGAATSVVNAQGVAVVTEMLGPLPAGAEAGESACAWVGVCAALTVRGVGLDALRIEVVSGGAQTVGSGDTLQQLQLRVTDGAGHPVAGAGVTVHQSVSEWQQACPDQGRCPLAAVYETAVSTLTSDVDGILSFLPLQIAGTPEVTQVAAAVGTQGFVTVALEKQP